MVCNQFIACEICNTKINLRIQFGYFNIRFNLRCPECNTHIYGEMKLNQESDNKLNVVNAVLTEPTDNDYFCAELSAEFPTRKLYLRRKGEEFDVSPFIRNIMFTDGSEQSLKLTRDSMRFANFLSSEWTKTKVYYNLFWKKKSSILKSKLLDEIKIYDFLPIKEIRNDLDIVMTLHQIFLCTSGVGTVISDVSLSEYSKTAKIITSMDINEINRFMNDKKIDLNILEEKCFSLIDLFSNFYEQLVPVVSLKNAGKLDKVDRLNFGIMTANFDELTSFYAKSYEWILENNHIIIALNNIFIRNNYDCCINGKTLDDIQELKSKFMSLNYMKEDEPFSRPTNHFNNRIRNAIQHYSCEIDYVSQKAMFIDSHKGIKKVEEIYLIDFSILCIENFSVMMYLFELIYNLRKIQLLTLGYVPSIKSKDIQKMKIINDTKIRRKGPCPCGSGKKYKNCCEEQPTAKKA